MLLLESSGAFSTKARGRQSWIVLDHPATKALDGFRCVLRVVRTATRVSKCSIEVSLTCTIRVPPVGGSRKDHMTLGVEHGVTGLLGDREKKKVCIREKRNWPGPRCPQGLVVKLRSGQQNKTDRFIQLGE